MLLFHRGSVGGFALLTALCLPPIPATGQYPAENVELFSHLTVQDFGATSARDCWGYVSPTGREYAIIGLSNGAGFVEITDPANPVILAVMPQEVALDMKVYQNYIYSASTSVPETNVYDVSDIDNGVITLVRTLNIWPHNLAVDEVSGFLYAVYSGGGGALEAYDLSDPSDPTLVGLWLGGGSHDAQVVTYTEGRYAGRQIAFVASGRARSLAIVDVTDKSNMFTLGEVGYPFADFAHQGWLSEDRRYFYLGDEGDEIAGQPFTRTFVFDVTRLRRPTYVDFFTSGLPATDHNLYVHQGFIYEANYSSGLRIFDASDPVHPVEVGYFDTFPSSNAAGSPGAWTAYPFFPSGTVIVSDIIGGLFVVDVSDAVALSGDLNCDGAVNALDIEPFLVALFDPAQYPIQFPECDINNGDINGDGSIDALDIEGFLDLLFP